MNGERFDLTHSLPLPRIERVNTDVLPDIWPEFCRKHRIHIHAVLMYENPIENQKLWAAWGVITKGIVRGEHERTDTLIDSTSGNFGVALAFVLQEIRRRFPEFPVTRVVAVVPASLPEGKKARLRQAGVELEFAKDSIEAMDVAAKLAKEKGYWYTKQYWNEDNCDSYFRVGEHVGKSLPNLKALACGVGSGGSLAGVMQWFRTANLHCVAVAVEPGSKVPGVRDSAGLEPGTLPWRRCASDIRYFGTDRALQFSHALWQQNNCIAGPSSGFALAGGLLSLHCMWTLHRLAHMRKSEDDAIEMAVLFPDTREPYRSEYEAAGYVFPA